MVVVVVTVVVVVVVVMGRVWLLLSSGVSSGTSVWARVRSEKRFSSRGSDCCIICCESVGRGRIIGDSSSSASFPPPFSPTDVMVCSLSEVELKGSMRTIPSKREPKSSSFSFQDAISIR